MLQNTQMHKRIQLSIMYYIFRVPNSLSHPHSLSPQFRTPYAQIQIRLSEPVWVGGEAPPQGGPYISPGTCRARLVAGPRQDVWPALWRGLATCPYGFRKPNFGVGNREFGIGEIGNGGAKANMKDT